MKTLLGDCYILALFVIFGSNTKFKIDFHFLCRFPLKIKGKVYRCCVRPAILCGSETWCLKESEMTILRTERAMIRAMCDVKMVIKKSTEELINMLGLHETMVRMAKASGVRWYGHVLQRDKGDVLQIALELEVNGKQGKG